MYISKLLVIFVRYFTRYQNGPYNILCSPLVDTISLNTVRGRLRPTMAISDVELSGSNLHETQSMQASSM
jgi:hypothetical protein